MALGGQLVSQDNYGKLLEPGLRKICFEAHNEKSPQYTGYVNMLTSGKAIETDMRMGGFGLFDKKGTMEPTRYEDPTETGIVQYRHETFSKGFIVEKEMVDDEQYNQITKLAKALGRSARSSIEIFAAQVLNSAFTASPTNWKGEALISGTHSRLDGATTSNAIGALALNEQNLEIAMKLAAEQVDERGHKIQMNPDVLIVPRALEFVAQKIAKTASVPVVGTSGKTFAELDYNPMQGRFKIVVVDYLTSDKNWFLMDSSMNPLNFFWREKLNFKNETDFDTDAAKFKARYRCAVGWSDHRGILGANPA